MKVWIDYYSTCGNVLPQLRTRWTGSLRCG